MKKHMKRVLFKGISVFLSIVMIVVSFPLSVLAKNESRTQNMDKFEKKTETDTTVSKEDNVTRDPYELIDKRTQTAKYYQLSDGTQMIAEYGYSIHYLDKSGKWLDIDNTLLETDQAYETHTSRVKFTKQAKENTNLFTLKENDRSISVTLQDTSKNISQGAVNNDLLKVQNAETALEKLQNLDHFSAEILYAEILDGVDLQYFLFGESIKENIIVKNYRKNYNFTFSLKLEKLTASVQSDNSILLSDSLTGDPCYIIPVGYMTDATGAYSGQVKYRLTGYENGNYILTIIADPEWVNAPERVFPVTIDPTITVSQTSATFLSISSIDANTNSLNNSSLAVSNQQYVYWKTAVLPYIPLRSSIINAKFSMKYSAQQDSRVGVYKVETNWDDTLNWSKLGTSPYPGSISQTPLDYQHLTSFSEGERIEWDITEAVKLWYVNNTSNYGLSFRPINSSSGTNLALFYGNSSDIIADNRPVFTIMYQNMSGIEDYWSYSSQDVGFAGSGSVNNATGELTFAIPTLTTTDALMPFTPTLVYGSELSGLEYSYPNASMSIVESYAPKSFKLNSCETLLKTSDGNYIWCDSDGTEHWFEPTEQTNEYQDIEGFHLKLVADDNNQTATMTAQNGSSRTFQVFEWNNTPYTTETRGLYLTKYTDQSGNKISIAFNSSKRPTAYSLIPNGKSSIQQMKIGYNSQNRINMIWNPTSGEAVIFHYSATPTGNISTTGAAYLRRMIRVHATSLTESGLQSFYNLLYTTSYGTITVDAVAEYIYNSNGYLIRVNNGFTNTSVQYTYNSSNQISSVQEFGAQSVSGQKISFTYRTTATDIRSSGKDDVYGNTDDLISTYIFDYKKRVINSYIANVSHTVLYGAANNEFKDNTSDIECASQLKQQSSNYLLNGGFEDGLLNWNHTQGVQIVDFYHNNHVEMYPSESTESISQSVSLYAGKYTLSLLFSGENSTGFDVFLKVLQNGSTLVCEQIPNNEENISGETPFMVSFEINTSVSSQQKTVEIRIEATNPISYGGYVYIENIMLSKTANAAPFDILQSGDFDRSGALNSWTGLTNDGIYTTLFLDKLRGKILKIQPTNEQAAIWQLAYQASEEQIEDYEEDYESNLLEEEDVVFSLAGWGRSEADVEGSSDPFCICIEITYHKYDSVEQNWIDTTDTKCCNFCKDTDEWQFVSGSVVARATDGLVKKVRVGICYGNVFGEGYFDSISCIKDYGDSVQYDYYGNGYVSYSRQGEKQAWYYYYPNFNLKWIAYSDMTYTQYVYDSNRRVTKITQGTYTSLELGDEHNELYGCVPKQTTVYTYNSYGLVINTKTKNGDGTGTTALLSRTSNYITTSGSHIFGAIDNETNSNGGVTRYFYNEKKGLLLAKTEPNEKGTSYTYNSLGQLTGAQQAVFVVQEIYNGNLANLAQPNSIVDPEIDFIETYEPVTNGTQVNYAYDSIHRLNTITTDTAVYTFQYDVFGNSTGVAVGNQTLASYTYAQNNGKLQTLTYGNGLVVRYIYDELDRVIEVQYNIGTTPPNSFETVYSYTYDTAGNLNSITDHRNAKVTRFVYDSLNRFSCSYVTDISSNLNELSSWALYDSNGRIGFYMASFNYIANGINYLEDFQITYSYSDNGELDHYMCRDRSGGYDIYLNNYDALNRITQKVLQITNTFSITSAYTYGTSTYSQPAQVSQLISTVTKNNNTSSTTYKYTYDSVGNITQIKDSSNVIQYRYIYDDLGQLIREDNRPLGYSYTYTYDKSGNRTSAKKYSFTTSTTLGTVLNTTNYTYGNSNWQDLLTQVGSESITYDAIGNPTSIGGKTLVWEGRQLQTFTNANNQTSLYTYNADGIRYSKTANGIAREYLLLGNKAIGERWEENNVEHLLLYLYDETDSPIGLSYRTGSYEYDEFDLYYFEKNLQGDVVALYTGAGKKICTYKYDAWGVCTTVLSLDLTGKETQMCSLNPFRYRGYYYDTETGFYYLQSRYYNPSWGRFLNADIYLNANGDLLGYNLFAYCSNNSVMGYDPTGEWSWRVFTDFLVTAGAAVAGFVVGGATTMALTVKGVPAPIALGAGIIAGTATMGAINNAVNAIYYHFSNGESDLEKDPIESSYVQTGYIDRWTRLDYVKSKVCENNYSVNAWRYYSEYSAHMYGWLIFGWAKDKNIHVISNWAESAYQAQVEDSWDFAPRSFIPTILFGVLGI